MLKPIAAQRNARIVRTRIAEMFKVARNVKWQIGSTYWKIGRENAMFEKLVEQPAINPRQQCGCGFVRRSVWQVRAFDRTWPDQQIRQTLSDESLTDIFSNDIRSNPSCALRAIGRSHLPYFSFLRESRSFYETEVLDSG